MILGYDRAALQEYMDQVETVSEQMRRRQDESLNLYQSCRQRYTRTQAKLEEAAHIAYSRAEDAESCRCSAEIEYETARKIAEAAQGDEETNAARKRMQNARQRLAEAELKHRKASAAYAKVTGELRNLQELWSESAASLEVHAHGVEDTMATFRQLVSRGNDALNEYILIMDKVLLVLQGGAVENGGTGGGSTAAAGAGKQQPVGWCASNSMEAVKVDGQGNKTVSMTIDGVERSYPCTKAGMEEAYRHAEASGNQDMLSRTSAMFEIETLREMLELGEGEAGYAQLGGYHKDVKRQDPVGYESHHIPSQGVQDEDGRMLPAISITYEDHKLTSSFAGKQKKVYHSVFPSTIPETSYKESVIQNLEQGSPGYIDSIKHELLDLRSATGHRYDGGVSAYLDAVIDMLATRGIPKAKSSK